jgi:hypothetical protein
LASSSWENSECRQCYQRPNCISGFEIDPFLPLATSSAPAPATPPASVWGCADRHTATETATVTNTLNASVR